MLLEELVIMHAVVLLDLAEITVKIKQVIHVRSIRKELHFWGKRFEPIRNLDLRVWHVRLRNLVQTRERV